jgi:hypothetical protein
VDSSGVDLIVRFGDGPPVELEIVPGLELSARTVASLVAEAEATRASNDGRRRLLIVERFRPAIRRQLAEAGVSWIERDTGLVHLDASPYFVHDAESPGSGAQDWSGTDGGGKAQSRRPRPTRLMGLSGRCAESLILWCEAHAGQPVPPVTATILAALADVTAPMATYVLHRLEREGTLVAHRQGRRTLDWGITRPDRILDLWSSEDLRPPRRTRAYVWARSPRDLLGKLTKLSSVADKWAIGGVAAANLYAPTLTADPMLTVWIPDALAAEIALKALGGDHVTEGANLTLQQVPNDPWALHRFDLSNAARTARPQRLAGDATEANEPPDATKWRKRLQDAYRAPPELPHLPHVALVSRPRAVVEALRAGRGRSEEVAEALRERLALETEPC